MKILELAQKDGLEPKKVSSAGGGEYHCPCPGCGGDDRFIIWDITNRYLCRRCEKTGDNIQYLRDFHNLSFGDALKELNITKEEPYTPRKQFNKNVFIPKSYDTVNPEWQTYAMRFIDFSHKRLLNTPQAINYLKDRGLTLDTIKRFNLGWNPSAFCAHWEINGLKTKIWLPDGIVIPSYIDGELRKMKIRRYSYSPDDSYPKYVEIHGGASGFSLYGSQESSIMLVLESELDAILVQQETKDTYLTIALGGATKKPDTFVHNLLSNSEFILFSLDYDETGVKAYKWWKSTYKGLFIWIPPYEKSVGDAFKKGLDISSWLKCGVTMFKKPL